MTPKQAALKKSLIKGIHISKRYQEYYKNDREAYELILEDRYGVSSSKKLTIDQLKAFVKWLNYKTDELKQDKKKSTATEPQLHKIRELWHSVARTPTDEALRAFIYKITCKHYLHIDALTKTDAQKMIVVLEKMNKGK